MQEGNLSCYLVCVWGGGGGVRAGRRVCVWPYGAVVCAVNFQSKHCGFDPRRVWCHTSFFPFSISGWLPTAKCVCLSMSVVVKKYIKIELSLAKSSHLELCGARPGSSTVLVNSIDFAT